VSHSLNNLGLFTIPEYIWKTASSLQVLDLSSNNFSTLPEEVSLFVSLQELDVSANMLSSLPLSLCRLTSLIKLNVSRNALVGTLFENVFARSMKSLQEINASSNQLVGISVSVAELPVLTTLDVSGNDIRQLPEELMRIPTLIAVDACRNPLVELPAGLTTNRDIAHSIPVCVAPGLFIGSSDAVSNRYAMKHYGVSHILALGAVAAPEWPRSSTLMHENVDDGVDLLAVLPKYLSFIQTAMRSGRVHGQPLHLVEDTPNFYLNALQPTPDSEIRRNNLGVSSVLNEVVRTIDGPAHSDTNLCASVVIAAPRGSFLPAAVAAAYIMGTQRLSLSAAVGRILECTSSTGITALEDIPKEGLMAHLRLLEEGLARVPSSGVYGASLETPCWTRHLEPGLTGAMRMKAPLPKAHDAGVYIVKLLQERAEVETDVKSAQSATARAEEKFYYSQEDPSGSGGDERYDQVISFRLDKGKALAKLDQIDADIKWLSLSAALES